MTQQRPRAKADELRKGGRLEEAAEEYAALWPDGDPWTGWGYAHCLRKLGRTSEAVQVARDLHALDPDFRYGRSVYAWSLYDLYIKGSEDPAPDVLKAATTIVRLTASDEQAFAPTRPLVATVLRVAKAWASHGRDLRALEWLDKLDPGQLQSKGLSRSDESGRDQELASNRERYYSIRTRALERLGRWQECLETASRALTDCGRLHHDNDVWFARRIAIAKLKLGQADEALSELEQLAARKPAGFMQTNIAAAAWEMGDLERTFKHALQALLSSGDLGYKLEAARLLGEVLWKRGQADEARNHLRLCLAVRESKGWKPSEELAELAVKWNVESGESDQASLLKELRPLWKRWSEELSPRRSGRVLKMLPHGRAGFIRADDGEQFYFDTRDWKDRRSKPAEGLQVTFSTRPGFDRKRQRPTTMACEVSATSSQP